MDPPRGEDRRQVRNLAEAGLTPGTTTAVVLAGGRGSRLGGRIKGELTINGERLIDTVVDAALEAGCDQAIVVGEIHSDAAVTLREEPPFGGPVAGLAAALPELDTEWIMLLACDLPKARDLCRLITQAGEDLGPGEDGLVVTADGRAQWLAGLYRRTAIEDGLTRLARPGGVALRDLMGSMRLREVDDPDRRSRDIDTPEDLDAAVEGKDR